MKAFLDWFIPQSVRDDRNALIQARALVAIMLIGITLAPGDLLIQSHVGVSGTFADYAFIFVGLLVCVVWLKLGDAFHIVRHVVVALVLGHFVHLAFIAGGIGGFRGLWFIAFPLMAAFITGRKAGLMWSFAAFAAVLLVAFVKPETLGFTPVSIPEQAGKDLYFNALASIVIVVILLAYLFESS